ncbi:hypothetical protein [Natronomonas marina]|uniref:hypothetical protein n=1 Tax=Natronomonas marina TaxID=2961939 RepID=UPI0020CA1EF4|nr:hypothetical protein [Natronomonas marina]
MSSTDASRLRRRDYLSLIGGASTTALAGCELPLGPDIPPFVRGWAEVTADEETFVVLEFDGDIQSIVENNDINGDDIITNDEATDVELSIEPVPADPPWSVPDRRTVEGRVENYVVEDVTWTLELEHPQTGETETREVPWYTTGLIHVSDDIDVVDSDNAFAGRFPSGYAYEMPGLVTALDDELASRRDFDGLFEYRGYAPNRTLPMVDHFDYDPLVSLRAAAEYRKWYLAEIRQLYRYDYYVDNSIEDVIEVVDAIIDELSTMTVESILTAPLGGAIGGAIDLYSVHDALTTEFETLDQETLGLEELAGAQVNSPWLQPANEILGTVWRHSMTLIERNMALATAVDREGFRHHLSAYHDRVESDIDTWRGLRDLPSGPRDGQYWQAIYNHLMQVHDDVLPMLETERTELAKLQSAF